MDKTKTTLLKKTLQTSLLWGCIIGSMININEAAAMPGNAEAAVRAHEAAAEGGVEEFKTQLDDQIPKWQKKYGVPGVAVGIVHDGKIAYQLTYGYADKDKKLPVTDKTLFQAGSISKSLTAWGILHLADQGVLSLDDPVNKHLSRWQLQTSGFDPDEVTIRRLLSHTAGLPAHRGYLGTAPGKRLPTPEESLSGKGRWDKPLTIAKRPGEQAFYSGAGYTLLQLVIEEATGLPFTRYMDEEVLKPLGMASSSFRQDTDEPEMAKSYGYFGQELPDYRFSEQAAAGLRTNLTDLLNLLPASMDRGEGYPPGGGLLPGQLVDEMQRPVLGENGLGVFVRKLPQDRVLIYHDGSNRGWHSFYGLIPATRDGLVILTNSENGVDLRQDIYNAWMKYETGEFPESYYAVEQMRKTNHLIGAALGIALGAYLLVFVLRLEGGRRVFIAIHPQKPYIRLGIRTLLVLLSGSALIGAGYVWSVLSLYSGYKTVYLWVLAWHIALLIAGGFPKKPKTYRNKRDLTSS